MMKPYFQSIGIAGGMGPYAGLDLARKILDKTPAVRDQDHLPLTICSYPGLIAPPPAFLLDNAPVNPGEVIGDIMTHLARNGAGVIGMPCNTAHHPRILGVALAKLKDFDPTVRYVDMIESVIGFLTTRMAGIRRIGVLGTRATIATGIYQTGLDKAGLTTLYPSEEGRERVQMGISDPVFGVQAQASPVSDTARSLFYAEARSLVERGAEAIVLGCTEIPLALTEPEVLGVPLVDSTSVLAQELINAFHEL